MNIVSKQAKDVFGRWMHWQRVYQYRDITTFIHTINDDYWNHMAAECTQNRHLSTQMCKLFSLSDTGGFYQQSHFIEDKNAVLEFLFNSIENDFLELIDYLGTHHFSDPDVNQKQLADGVINVIVQYVDFLNTLFYHPDKFIQSEYLFSLANKVFEFCFSESTHGFFLCLLHEERYYPLARLTQSILWQFLSAEGWRDWHIDTLKNLQKECESGKTIVYVAGGTDIYALLASGIYNIEVIDPLLTSQASNFYSEGWSWLVEGGMIDDVLYINSKLMLRRKSHLVFGTFNAVTATGETISIAHTETIWSVHDIQLQKIVGSVTFKRRFARQEDFIADPSKTLLVSFNELYLLGAPKHCDGWGIDTHVLLNEMTIFVKQLRNPIKALALKRLTKVNDAPFKFVNLGGCAT